MHKVATPLQWSAALFSHCYDSARQRLVLYLKSFLHRLRDCNKKEGSPLLFLTGASGQAIAGCLLLCHLLTMRKVRVCRVAAVVTGCRSLSGYSWLRWLRV